MEFWNIAPGDRRKRRKNRRLTHESWSPRLWRSHGGTRSGTQSGGIPTAGRALGVFSYMPFLAYEGHFANVLTAVSETTERSQFLHAATVMSGRRRRSSTGRTCSTGASTRLPRVEIAARNAGDSTATSLSESGSCCLCALRGRKEDEMPPAMAAAAALSHPGKALRMSSALREVAY